MRGIFIPLELPAGGRDHKPLGTEKGNAMQILDTDTNIWRWLITLGPSEPPRWRAKGGVPPPSPPPNFNSELRRGPKRYRLAYVSYSL